MTKRHASRPLLLAIGSLGLAGCSAGQTIPHVTSNSTPTTSTTVSPGTVSAPITVAPAPTLGQLSGLFAKGQGFGQARPSEIYNGGDPTGLVTHVIWRSWGGAKAFGAGESVYVAANQDVAQGRDEPATVVAFDLGTCDDKLMYQATEWYFPQHGQTFSSRHYENICAGTYVTLSP